MVSILTVQKVHGILIDEVEIVDQPVETGDRGEAMTSERGGRCKGAAVSYRTLEPKWEGTADIGRYEAMQSDGGCKIMRSRILKNTCMSLDICLAY